MGHYISSTTQNLKMGLECATSTLCVYACVQVLDVPQIEDSVKLSNGTFQVKLLFLSPRILTCY